MVVGRSKRNLWVWVSMASIQFPSKAQKAVVFLLQDLESS